MVAEAMAFFMEKAIERHVSLCSGPPDWTFLSHSVIFPHMHIERLTKLSLQQSYCHVLHIYALQSLGATPNHDAELLIGEHIAGWLMGLNADGLEFEREGKVALLLAQFAHFLSLEMTHSGDLFGQSRLASLTPSLANLLLKWGEDRVSGGLWATLGFGPKSRFSLEFRFFCRGVGTYIASRCLPTDSPDRTALIGSLEALHSATEYERLVLYLDPLMDEFLLDDTKTLRDLSSVIAHQCRALFPQYVDSSFEVRGY